MVGPDRVEMDTLVGMTRSLRHRGPDDEGFLVREYDDGVAVGLGFRRLSIVDLSRGTSRSGTRVAPCRWCSTARSTISPPCDESWRSVATGSRRTPTPRSSLICTRSWDLGCVERLNGMFAFALWDEARRELLLARDRFGKKPLYYAQVGRSLIFGSELKSLLEHPRCPSELDPAGLSRYLALEYVPTPYAIFTGSPEAARRARPALARRPGVGRPVLEPLVRLRTPGDDPDTDDEYAEELTARLREAVRRRLMSDVPLGAFLSGGIDSSSIVAMMVEAMPSGTSRRSRSGSARGASTSRSTRGAWRSISAPITTRRSSRLGR